MANENLGANEDLGLNDEDADKVVGGKKKKKPVAKKKTVVHKTQAAAAVTPAAPMTQAQKDAYDKDMVDHSLDPVYGSTPTE